jgi:hypothetical protein
MKEIGEIQSSNETLIGTTTKVYVLVLSKVDNVILNTTNFHTFDGHDDLMDMTFIHFINMYGPCE